MTRRLALLGALLVSGSRALAAHPCDDPGPAGAWTQAQYDSLGLGAPKTDLQRAMAAASQGRRMAGGRWTDGGQSLDPSACSRPKDRAKRRVCERVAAIQSRICHPYAVKRLETALRREAERPVPSLAAAERLTRTFDAYEARAGLSDAEEGAIRAAVDRLAVGYFAAKKPCGVGQKLRPIEKSLLSHGRAGADAVDAAAKARCQGGAPPAKDASDGPGEWRCEDAAFRRNYENCRRITEGKAAPGGMTACTMAELSAEDILSCGFPVPAVP